MKIKPIFDRVVLKLIENKEQTASGIYIPESSSEKPFLAEVVAVGDDKDMKVKCGNKVLFSRFAGIEYKIEQEEFLIIRQGDILAIVEE